MIQPLRNMHRRVFMALSIILPAFLVVGLMARHRNARTYAQEIDAPRRAEASRVPLQWQKHSIETYFDLSPGHDEVTEVVLIPQRPIDEPDLLLYWAAADAVAADVTKAQLLGRFVPRKRYSLPSRKQRGELVLYSLAHREVVDHARVESVP